MKTGHERELSDLLRKYGAVAVHTEYSGGNDEGFVEPAVLVLADGSTQQLPGTYYSERQNPENPDFARINAILEGPIYDRYGSFAGEFSCQGTIDFTVDDAELTILGSESEEVWSDVEW